MFKVCLYILRYDKHKKIATKFFKAYGFHCIDSKEMHVHFFEDAKKFCCVHRVEPSRSYHGHPIHTSIFSDDSIRDNYDYTYPHINLQPTDKFRDVAKGR